MARELDDIRGPKQESEKPLSVHGFNAMVLLGFVPSLVMPFLWPPIPWIVSIILIVGTKWLERHRLPTNQLGRFFRIFFSPRLVPPSKRHHRRSRKYYQAWPY